MAKEVGRRTYTILIASGQWRYLSRNYLDTAFSAARRKHRIPIQPLPVRIPPNPCHNILLRQQRDDGVVRRLGVVAGVKEQRVARRAPRVLQRAVS